MFLLPTLESHEIFSVSNATWCHCVWQAFLLWIQRQCICLDKTSRIRWMLIGCIDHGNVYIYCSVPQIRPPFCNLSLNTKHGGGAYTQDATISLAIMPSLPIKLTPLLFVGGGWRPSVRHRRTRGGEMLPMLVVGWRASALRGKKAGRFREVAGMSIVDAGCLCLR